MWKGFDKFRAKLPVLAGSKILLLPLYTFFVLAAAGAVLLLFDALPGLLDPAGTMPALALLPPAGVLLTGGTGLLLVWRMWFLRDRLKKKYGALSYQRIFFSGLAGVLCFFSLTPHQYVPFYLLSASFWAASPLSVLAAPLGTLAGAGDAFFIVKLIPAVLIGLTGLLLVWRALHTFGFDYMTVVYLYFPEESRVQNHEIYSVLRHPAYAALLWINFSGALVTFTVYSFIVFFIQLVGFTLHVRLVEEKELLARFGDSYAAYRKKVPAFFTFRLGILFKFLRGGR